MNIPVNTHALGRKHDRPCHLGSKERARVSSSYTFWCRNPSASYQDSNMGAADRHESIPRKSHARYQDWVWGK
jgi:hypothetical protein